MNHPYQQLPQFPPSTSIVTNQLILLLYVMLFPGRAQEEILQSILSARFQIESVLYEKNNLLVLNARVMLLEWGVREFTAPQLHLGGVFVHSGNAPLLRH
jgi:hypothetical protein